jgi:DNA-binding CsgD family transcriptional regulator
VSGLLEREPELAELVAAVGDAADGTGSVVLLSGEAGIGKTQLVRAFGRAVSDRARVLLGACDDLLAPRPLGPLRDVARRAPGGPLATALAGEDRDAVLSAVRAELADPRRPTVLVVEDAHWADGATLDVLRFVGRRIADLPAVLLVSYRDDEIGPGHPLQRVLGGLTGPSVHRVALRPLSPAAVARLAGDAGVVPAALHRLTRGNPFFVSEVLAAPRGVVPATVTDVVLARVQRLDPAARSAVEQLAVVPSPVELPLARALLGELTATGEAERLGILEVRPDAVAFRHELARRAVEGALSAVEAMRLHARVLDALLARPDAELARVVHHAVRAGDDAAVVRHAPEAARRACAAGAQRQGVALYEHALERRALLSREDEAAISEACAWALYNANRQADAVRAAEDVVRLREELGEPGALARALALLALWQWSDLRPAAALATARRAGALLASGVAGPRRAAALVHLGVVLVHLDREGEGLAPLEEALALLGAAGPVGLRAMALMYRGRARLQLGDDDGLDELVGGLELAAGSGDHGTTMIGYVTVVALLWRLGRYPEMVRFLDEGAEYGRELDYATHDRGREAYRYRLMALQGRWDEAERGLRGIAGDVEDAGVLGRFTLPVLARLAVRRGHEDAVDLLAAARANAERADNLQALVASAVAELEHGWLTGRAEPARRAALALLPRTEARGRERERGELLRWLARTGHPAEAFDGCPEEFAAGLRGDWRAAAAAWERIGAPYERAVELADSGEVDPTLEALAVLDGLGARPAAALVRRRLRELGVRQVPRGPQPATRSNPAGLTPRQVEILRLLVGGSTNAEIAAALVLSVRTVDHHVSAVLQKLGVAGRREAAAAAAELLAGLDRPAAS